MPAAFQTRQRLIAERSFVHGVRRPCSRDGGMRMRQQPLTLSPVCSCSPTLTVPKEPAPRTFETLYGPILVGFWWACIAAAAMVAERLGDDDARRRVRTTTTAITRLPNSNIRDSQLHLSTPLWQWECVGGASLAYLSLPKSVTAARVRPERAPPRTEVCVASVFIGPDST